MHSRPIYDPDLRVPEILAPLPGCRPPRAADPGVFALLRPPATFCQPFGLVHGPNASERKNQGFPGTGKGLSWMSDKAEDPPSLRFGAASKVEDGLLPLALSSSPDRIGTGIGEGGPSGV